MPTITENNKTIKKLAMQMLRGHWASGLLIMFIMLISTAVPSLLVDTFAPESTLAVCIYNLYVLLISGPIKLGACIFFLSCMRAECKGLNSLAFGFEYYRKATVLYINVMFRVLVFGLLFIIPGIITYIRLSQSFFILADDPGKSVDECMAESKYIMLRNAGPYIMLFVGFILYYIIAEIPRFIATKSMMDAFFAQGITVIDADTYLEFADYMNSASAPLYSYLSQLLEVVVDTFRYMALAAFYELASGKLVIKREYEAV